MGFTFLKDYSGPYVEMDWRVQEWEARRLLQRFRQEAIMAWTGVDGEKRTDRETFQK